MDEKLVYSAKWMKVRETLKTLQGLITQMEVCDLRVKLK